MRAASGPRWRPEKAALRGTALTFLWLVANGVWAQISGSATVVSDYRYRGFTLSDRKPAGQVSVTYDDPVGWYVGGFASTVDFAPPVGIGGSVQGTAFAGYASRLASGLTLEAGGDYSVFANASGDNYGEVYVGASADNFGARIYYSPSYFGQHVGTVYAELNASQPLIDRLRIVMHVGWLGTRSTSLYGGRGGNHVWDGRVGLAADIERYHLELAWVGVSSPYAAYRVNGSNSPNTVVLSVSLAF